MVRQSIDETYLFWQECIVTQVRQGWKILNWIATLLFQQVANQHRGPWDWNVKYLEKKWKNGVLSKQRNILYFFIVFFLFSSLSSSLFHRRISFLFFFLSVSHSYSLCCHSLCLALLFSLLQGYSGVEGEKKEKRKRKSYH